MSLKLEFLDGPLEGRVFNFPSDQHVIEIGRDPDHCQVVFPADFTSVGRRHLVIRQVGGRYRLETHPGNAVVVDGREPLDGEPLGRSQVVGLGRSAARMKLTTSFPSALPETDVSKPQKTLSQRLANQRRSFALLFVAILILAGGLAWFYAGQDREQRQIAALSNQMAKLQQSSVSPDVLRKASESVYLVLIRNDQGEESPVGTAWVFDSSKLATNAHVAATFNELEPGQRLVARGTVEPFDTVEIEAVAIHPDYEAFDAEWQRAKPSRTEAGGGVQPVNAPGAGYDVALMQVVAGAALAAPLPLADAAELEKLSAGTAVAFAGFPMEALAGGGVNPKAPIAQTQVGHVTAVSDYFLLPSVSAERLLIQHAIPVTGGASGSPMIDGNGRVVGLISGMNVIGIESGRAPNAVGINFAQRADLLHELTDVPSADRVATRRDAWSQGFASFDDPTKAIPRQLEAMWLAELGTEEPPVALPPVEAVLEPGGENGALIHYFGDVFTKPGSYLVLAMSKKRHDIDIAVSRGEEIVAQDDAYDWYPSATVTVSESEGGETGLIVYMENQAQDGPAGAQSEADRAIVLHVWMQPQ